jgi:hypothetical protein
MSPDAMRYYINHLAATSHEPGRTKNYGVGAKVAAGSRNRHGLEYRSWRHGRGALVCFKRDSNGRWGLEPRQWPDGRRDFWCPLMDSEKPWAVCSRPHGTQVVLLGQHERDDTTQAPKTVTEARQRWIARSLNMRLRRLPDLLELLVRSHQRNVRRDISEFELILGQKPRLHADRDDHRTPGQPTVKKPTAANHVDTARPFMDDRRSSI